MKTYIPLNTLCADGRNIAMMRNEAFLEHRHAESMRLRLVEAKHMETCTVCNPALQADLRVRAMLRALWPEARVME